MRERKKKAEEKYIKKQKERERANERKRQRAHISIYGNFSFHVESHTV